MLQESVEALSIQPEGIYVDATFGGGGHAAAVLEHLNEGGLLLAFDQDADAAVNAQQSPFAGHPAFRFVPSNFRFLKRQLRGEGLNPGSVNGILADLGVSSYQLDTAERGFSYRFDALLDMRMNRREGPTAADLLNTETSERLQQIFSELGEVRNARTLAQACLRARERKPFRTTGDLLDVLDPITMGEKWRYRSQVFQALRMQVNDELGALTDFLKDSLEMLAVGGLLVVITYHSIEDRLVKNFQRSGNTSGEIEQDFYGRITRPFELLTKKPLEPAEAEIRENPRARSARLRVARKLDVQPTT